ncbi:hypothetical protein N0V88_006896 [Collariella sp. IMI 366227]|nr:hypothetical protein N0V88_006896 [Collariella sp. IMI 366227]
MSTATSRAHELQKLYKNLKTAAGNAWEETLLENAHSVSAPLALVMLEQMGLNQDTTTPFTLLENACGAGVVAPLLQQTIKPEVLKQSSIICGDFSEQVVGLAQKRIETEGWVNTEAMQIDAQENGLPTGAFTHVATNIGFHVVSDSEAALNEAIRILRPGGILGLTTWHTEPAWVGDVREAFQSFPFKAPFEMSMQTTAWGNWADVNWVRKTLVQKGLQDVRVKVFAFLSHVKDANSCLAIYGMMVDWIVGSSWPEELRKQHPKEEVHRLVKEFLEKKYGRGGWEYSWVVQPQSIYDLSPSTSFPLANLLAALASIDRRLCRIETALKIPNSTNPNPAVPNTSAPTPSTPPRPHRTRSNPSNTTTINKPKKCGCMFKFEVVETTKDSDVWVLHYPNEEHKVHNHGPSDTTSDPRARKLPGKS